MNQIKFQYHWHDGEGIEGPEFQTTYAALCIEFDDQVLTETKNIKTKTTSEWINIPLYPLAEWVALNWWFLKGEVFNLKKASFNNYNERHNIFFAQEGYALPSLTMRPSGNSVELIWERYSPAYNNLEFINSGRGTVSQEQLFEGFSDLIEGVINRLIQNNIHDTILQREWEAISNTFKEEEEFCVLAASIGLDPYDLSDHKKNLILQAHKKLPGPLVSEFFTICRERKIEADTKVVLKALEKIHNKTVSDNKETIAPLQKIREDLMGQQNIKPTSEPWVTGYEAAKTLRRKLKLNGEVLVELNDLEKAIRLPKNELDQYVEYDAQLPETLQVVAGLNKSDHPGFIFREKKTASAGKKFLLTRSLYNYFFESSSDPYLITFSHTDLQKKNRAFAAEFLVPANTLKKKVKKGTISEEEIGELAEEMNVSTMLVGHQIENHRIAEIERDS